MYWHEAVHGPAASKLQRFNVQHPALITCSPPPWPSFCFPSIAGQLIRITPHMSHAHSSQAPPSSTNFQSIFVASLKAYKKKTKNDLLVHPPAAQLQACKSPHDILAVLQDKVKDFHESRRADERLSRCLSPTINVLYAFSETLGQSVGLVGPIQSNCRHPTP